ncbi:MAG: four helix bundle protein [Gemmatimonadetes bacterium]|nr:four helix bundle protein [Gemmatimonadota bacterium]MBK6781274.1 four helix bundle protein [Gemmatimonadota bacterium]MBK7350493.1 four helix bundle protein [Gemmatimonadota bacterium]MBK7785638.1 four helix bundle protein [Gemmatimonadota bacterium]
MFAFERLEAWRACHALALQVYSATKTWPREERYGLTSQVRRAAVSAVSNIAEGAAKRGPREFGRYLDIALGSLAELACQLMLARDMGVMPIGEWAEVNETRESASKLTWRLYEAVRKPRSHRPTAPPTR